MIVIGLDPGYRQSAFVTFDGERVMDHQIADNEDIRQHLKGLRKHAEPAVLVIEQMQMFRSAFGVGAEVFDSVYWSGRFAEIWDPWRVERMLRAKVRGHLHAIKGGDAAVRQGLIVRFGGYKETAIGSKKNPGPCFGIKSHEWSALALAVTWWDLFRDAPQEVRPGVMPQHDGTPKRSKALTNEF